MKNIERLASLYGSYDRYLAKSAVSTKPVNIETVLANIFCPGKFFHYLLDSPTLTLEAVSDHSREIFGVDLEGESLEALLDLIHPEDFSFVLACEDYVADFVSNKIQPDKILKYKFSYCVRLKTRNDIFKLFLIQNIVIDATSDGQLLKVLGIHSDISHITSFNNYKLSIFGLSGEPSYLGINVQDINLASQVNLFSDREIEVIRLLAQGFIGKEIAAKLHVSEETIKSHKKNAMRKSGVKNSNQLVGFSLTNGLL